MNLQLSNHIETLKGDVIKDIFIHAQEIADLHAVLTSPRGNYLKKKLLSKLSEPLEEKEVKMYSEKSDVREYKRHVHKLIKFGLLTQQPGSVMGEYIYRRTYEGEEALNMTRQLEGKFGPDRIKKLYKASLGKNSIRLFLKVYGSPKELRVGEDIIYTPLEIGQISSFLPRTVEGIAAIDKLDSAGLVSYLEDGKIHVNPRRSTVFYYYLKGLYQLIFKKQND